MNEEQASVTQQDVVMQLLTDLQWLEQTLEQIAAALSGTGDDAATVHEALLRLQDDGTLEQDVQQAPHELLAQVLGHAQRSVASMQRLHGRMPAIQPALANLYHLIAVLERHAWQADDRAAAPAWCNSPHPVGGFSLTDTGRRSLRR